jgi:hypothetical protein
MSLPKIDQVPDLTVVQLLPYMSERGRVEAEAALQRLQIDQLEQAVAERDERIKELEP